MKLSSIYLQLLLLVFCTSVFAQTVTFELISNAGSANDMSPDGRYIVGETNTGSPYLLDTQTGMMTLLPAPGLNAVAVSDDGTFVAGDIPDPKGIGSNVAARWSQATGWVSLGALPNAGMCPSRSDAYEISADGSVVVGLSFINGCASRGFHWTEANGMLELDEQGNGVNRASVCSADGSLIGGFAQGSFSRTPCFWRDDQSGELLDPPDGDALGEIHGIKDDGSIMLGAWNDGTNSGASKWTFNGGTWDREEIGNGSILNGWTGIPTDMSDDDTVVGFDILQTTRRAWIQYQGEGNLILLKAWANSNGANIPAAQELEVCQAISADGTKIIGHGFFTGAWIINITPDILLGDVNLDGVVTLLDVAPFVDRLSTGTFQAEADINGDGMVNLLDVAGFIAILGG